MTEVKTETETAALFDVDNFDPEFKGCDAVWPYDQEQAYAGAKKWALTLSVALEAARQETDNAQSYSDADTQTAAAMASRATLAEEKLRKAASEFQGIFDKWQAAESELAGLRETVGALSETLERLADHPILNRGDPTDDCDWHCTVTLVAEAKDALARLRGSQETT